MDLTRLLVQLLIAIVCASIANILVPRQIPGKGVGLVVIGLAGVYLGEQGASLLQDRYGLSIPGLEWAIQGVPILPSIIGSAVILYVVTAFLSWGHYGNR
ncbi:hypothetical protein XM38_049070 [Halomicronema hongdechloris C2206]|uniref:Uncharacterized protein n=1 Tax=Halomicronema hongdechloris C2206 TaxID=1641165 RepID=A0A1Z3HUH0_9CYAN|nr:hypothetical protein [Halomicronema hongdechloris]ASC73933.1 hypothetical protein XM38_049070 [Halomicronema hongdechloris C2206]